jgi:hypothetical protein
MSTEHLQQPKITKDPRFRAARKLIESGRDGAIDMFGMLLEEARTKYGEASIETAPAYFEYGVALFRESQRQQEAAREIEDDQKPAAVETPDTDKSEPKEKSSEEAGDDAENDDKENGGEEEENGEEEEGENNDDDDEEEDQAEPEEEDDLELAFSMMETAFAVYDNYVQLAKSSPKASSDYLEWAERVQLPRILSNIGDLLSAMGRHADAADTYTRELLYRDLNLARYENKEMSMEELVDRRKSVEANVLVATELLACEPGQDVITTETQSCLVKAAEREEFAGGYYEQARDQLQETVYLMAKLVAAAKDDKEKAELQKEKENVCFASTLVMGVGEQLAALKEQATEKEKELEPAKKKAKR